MKHFALHSRICLIAVSIMFFACSEDYLTPPPKVLTSF